MGSKNGSTLSPVLRAKLSRLAKLRNKANRTKKYHCPVHGEIVGMQKWAGHVRKCKVAARVRKSWESPKSAVVKVRKIAKKGKVIKKATESTPLSPQSRRPIVEPVEKETVGLAKSDAMNVIPFGVHNATVILRNGNEEQKIVSFVHGGDLPALAEAIRRLMLDGFAKMIKKE